MVSIAAGALYSMQGCKSEGSLWGFTGKSTTKLDYLNVPIVANVYVVPGLAVKLGLQPGFNLSAKSKLEGSIAGYSGESERDIDVESFDLSLPIGLSYEFQNFVIDGRYNFGLTKTFKDADPKQSVFQITLGYKFAL